MLHSIVVGSSYKFRLPVVLLICIVRVADCCYLYHTNYRSDNTVIVVSNIKNSYIMVLLCTTDGTTGCSLHGEEDCRIVDDGRGSRFLYPPLMTKDSRVPW